MSLSISSTSSNREMSFSLMIIHPKHFPALCRLLMKYAQRITTRKK